MLYPGPSAPCGVCQLMSCVGTLMSHVLQWMQLGMCQYTGISRRVLPARQKPGSDREILTSAH
jgi:hypothetical protein